MVEKIYSEEDKNRMTSIERTIEEYKRDIKRAQNKAKRNDKIAKWFKAGLILSALTAVGAGAGLVGGFLTGAAAQTALISLGTGIIASIPMGLGTMITGDRRDAAKRKASRVGNDLALKEKEKTDLRNRIHSPEVRKTERKEIYSINKQIKELEEKRKVLIKTPITGENGQSFSEEESNLKKQIDEAQRRKGKITADLKESSPERSRIAKIKLDSRKNRS
jgi:hypothetical protein